jgi:transcriptional regulator with XRE-family HTH domain
MPTVLTPGLRPLREQAGLTQQQLANKAKVRQATVSALETGTAAGIRTDTVVRLARALGVKPPRLFCPEAS